MAGEERIKRPTPENDPFFRTEEKSQFSPDVTPLILAAQYNNHEIVQMFLSRNHTIERPHVISYLSLTSLRSDGTTTTTTTTAAAAAAAAAVTTTVITSSRASVLTA